MRNPKRAARRRAIRKDPSRCARHPVRAADRCGAAAQKNVHVVLTQPNEVRGNHVHRTAVEITSVVGPCLIRLKEDGVIRDIEVPAGEICA